MMNTIAAALQFSVGKIRLAAVLLLTLALSGFEREPLLPR